MSDKPLVQQNLAADLAELLLLIKPKRQPGATDEEVETERFEAACGFLQGFWTAIVREWTGIDRLRCVAETEIGRMLIGVGWTNSTSLLGGMLTLRFGFWLEKDGLRSL